MSNELPRMLLVEDSPTDALLVKHALRREYAIDAVRSAGEAMARLRDNAYLVVITDYGLPDMSGLDLLAWVKEQGLTVPVRGIERSPIRPLPAFASSSRSRSSDNRASPLTACRSPVVTAHLHVTNVRLNL